MLAYRKTYEEFCEDINKGQIVSAIVTALNRDFSDSEKRAFRNSLRIYWAILRCWKKQLILLFIITSTPTSCVL